MRAFKFSNGWMDSLNKRAKSSPRLRQHYNIHRTSDDACQCLFNAIGMDSYIRPHRHLLDPKDEFLIAIRGLFALITFFDDGKIESVQYFGTEVYSRDEQVCTGFLLSPQTWHTVIALKADSVLMEIKPGPFLANLAKEMAPWSPEEGSIESAHYFLNLKTKLFASVD